MADAFGPSPFPPIAPRNIRPPPTREELRSYSRYRKTSGITSTPPVTPNPLYKIWNDTLFWDDQYIWDE